MQVQRLFLALGCQCQGVVDLRDLAARCGTLTAAERSCSLATLVSAAAVPHSLAASPAGYTLHVRYAGRVRGGHINPEGRGAYVLQLGGARPFGRAGSNAACSLPARSLPALARRRACRCILSDPRAAPDAELFRCRSSHGEPAAFGAFSAPFGAFAAVRHAVVRGQLVYAATDAAVAMRIYDQLLRKHQIDPRVRAAARRAACFAHMQRGSPARCN
jgi:hypothetical protein